MRSTGSTMEFRQVSGGDRPLPAEGRPCVKRLILRRKTMRNKKFRAIAIKSFALLVVLGTAYQAMAQDAKPTYPSMAPLEQYLMADRNAEIALARSAAPESVSGDAEVLVLGRHGYETAVKGKNGFVCLVERGWTAGVDDPDFWNPKLRGPLCLNPQAARSYLPLTIRKTELVLAGQSKPQMVDGIRASFEKKELPTLEPGAMCYMLSKQGYLSDRGGHWHPHLMFFVAPAIAPTWGVNLPGSPILGSEDAPDRLTVVMIPVAKWSDGTADPTDAH